MPAAQLEHPLADIPEYIPAEQVPVIVTPPKQKLPDGHADDSDWPVIAQKVPAPQVTQVSELPLNWKVPIAQLEHILEAKAE